MLCSREYFVEFACSFNLKYYPFDTQVCTIQMEGSPMTGITLVQDGEGVTYSCEFENMGKFGKQN